MELLAVRIQTEYSLAAPEQVPSAAEEVRAGLAARVFPYEAQPGHNSEPADKAVRIAAVHTAASRTAVAEDKAAPGREVEGDTAGPGIVASDTAVPGTVAAADMAAPGTVASGKAVEGNTVRPAAGRAAETGADGPVGVGVEVPRPAVEVADRPAAEQRSHPPPAVGCRQTPAPRSRDIPCKMGELRARIAGKST
jgi:hypothetical protein